MILFLFLAIVLAMGVPIGISLGVASVAGIAVIGSYQLELIAQSMITALDSFPLMAVPFFILAGEIMGQGGISIWSRLFFRTGCFFGKYRCYDPAVHSHGYLFGIGQYFHIRNVYGRNYSGNHGWCRLMCI